MTSDRREHSGTALGSGRPRLAAAVCPSLNVEALSSVRPYAHLDRASRHRDRISFNRPRLRVRASGRWAPAVCAVAAAVGVATLCANLLESQMCFLTFSFARPP